MLRGCCRALTGESAFDAELAVGVAELDSSALVSLLSSQLFASGGGGGPSGSNNAQWLATNLQPLLMGGSSSGDGLSAPPRPRDLITDAKDLRRPGRRTETSGGVERDAPELNSEVEHWARHDVRLPIFRLPAESCVAHQCRHRVSIIIRVRRRGLRRQRTTRTNRMESLERGVFSRGLKMRKNVTKCGKVLSGG